jgi:hypothetical protein
MNSCWNIDGIDYSKKAKSIDAKKRVTDVQNQVRIAIEKVNKSINSIPNQKKARDVMNEHYDEQNNSYSQQQEYYS